MDSLSVPVTFTKFQSFSFVKPIAPEIHNLSINITRFPNNYKTNLSSSPSSSSSFNFSCNDWSLAATTYPFFSTPSTSTTLNRHWMVLMETPPHGVHSKPQIIDYYVKTLQTLLGSEKDAQMCIYDASWDTHYGFCCDIDEEISSQLASLPGVLSVRPDPDFNSLKKDYSLSSVEAVFPSIPQSETNMLFPAGNSKHWLVRMDKPGVGVVTKAQIVDYYAQILTKVMGNETDAQMCIYHVSWKTNFGFCCELDEDCAQALAGVPGVLSVQPDNNFESETKDYGGSNVENSLTNSDEGNQAAPLKTKKLFVTGLSFYTSEKTLRAAFEGFGELVQVKVIMDKISKRSKGYAFIEYTTEEAASAALKEMNGKDLFIAGTDTTAATLEWALTELVLNPKIMSKAKEELEEIIGKAKPVEESDITKLPYLQAIIKETLRLHPPVPLLLPRKAERDVEICGFTIPKDAQVMVNVWTIGRDPTLWDNPSLFSPERFLGSEIDIKGRNFELAPFGGGRRICPGIMLAIRMLILMLGSLINSFDWKLEDGMKLEDVDMDENFGITLQKAQPLRLVPVYIGN